MSNPSIETAAKKARIQIGRLNMATLISVDHSTRIIFGHTSCFVRELTKRPNKSVRQKSQDARLLLPWPLTDLPLERRLRHFRV
jgi:hypothetical protein